MAIWGEARTLKIATFNINERLGILDVVPTVQDIYPSRSLAKSPGVCSAARSGLDRRSAKTAARGYAPDVLGR